MRILLIVTEISHDQNVPTPYTRDIICNSYKYLNQHTGNSFFASFLHNHLKMYVLAEFLIDCIKISFSKNFMENMSLHLFTL